MNKEFFRLLENIDSNKFDMVYSSPNGMTVLRSSEYGFRLDQIHELKQEKIKLQQRIDKAIEYIKSKKCKYDGWEITTQLYEDEIKQLEEILKGGNNEN